MQRDWVNSVVKNFYCRDSTKFSSPARRKHAKAPSFADKSILPILRSRSRIAPYWYSQGRICRMSYSNYDARWSLSFLFFFSLSLSLSLPLCLYPSLPLFIFPRFKNPMHRHPQKSRLVLANLWNSRDRVGWNETYCDVLRELRIVSTPIIINPNVILRTRTIADVDHQTEQNAARR